MGIIVHPLANENYWKGLNTTNHSKLSTLGMLSCPPKNVSLTWFHASASTPPTQKKRKKHEKKQKKQKNKNKNKKTRKKKKTTPKAVKVKCPPLRFAQLRGSAEPPPCGERDTLRARAELLVDPGGAAAEPRRSFRSLLIRVDPSWVYY